MLIIIENNDEYKFSVFRFLCTQLILCASMFITNHNGLNKIQHTGETKSLDQCIYENRYQLNTPEVPEKIKIKFRIRETKNLSTDADSSTDIFVFAGVKKGADSNFFLKDRALY